MILSFYLDVQELQHAVSVQQIASPHPYKKDYKEQIVGKGPHDPTIGYPEHDHHKKVGELASSVSHSIFYRRKFAAGLNRTNIHSCIRLTALFSSLIRGVRNDVISTILVAFVVKKLTRLDLSMHLK